MLEALQMINADEIAGILKQQIANYKTDVNESQIGTVIEAGDNIARVYGLDDVQQSELVEFNGGIQGIALNLEEDNVGVVVMGDVTQIKEGDQVRRTGRIASVPVGKALLGRVVNPLGEPVDGKGPIETKKYRTIENTAPTVVQRQGVKQPLQTGIRAIDALIPIGKGQRELIIGDRGTGKTAIAIDTIINQKGQNVFCIYVAIGQKNSTVASVAQTLEKAGAMEYTTIVTVSSAEPAALKYIAPFAGCAMGEELMYQGNDVLIIYDNLTQHAIAYREVSLLLRRPPGREAYPGDIFYLHSRLLERAAKLSDELGGGSLTALPVIETQAGDVSAYIPTNLISITDGQIYLQSSLFFQGIRPAVDVGISVSRVGGSAQIKAMRTVAGPLKLDLAQYRELAAFAKLSSDLDKNTQAQLTRGEKITEILKQPQYEPQKVEDQILLIYAATKGFLTDIPTPRLQDWAHRFISFVHEKYATITDSIVSSKQLSDDNAKALEAAINEFNKSF
jgi:F-type H+-transporting ATPase subunit alpha